MFGRVNIVLLFVAGIAALLLCCGLYTVTRWVFKRLNILGQKRTPRDGGSEQEYSASLQIATDISTQQAKECAMPQSTPPEFQAPHTSEAQGKSTENSSKPEARRHSFYPTGLREHSPLVRFGIVTLITLVLLIPLSLVESMVHERSSLYNSVLRDINSTWGGLQQLSGPALLIPYTERQAVEKQVQVDNKRETVRDFVEVVNYMIVLPDTIKFAAQLLPEERQRGIYHSLVYTAHLSMHGIFSLPTKEQIDRLIPALVAIDYTNAYVVVGISHPSALREVSPLQWNDAPVTVEPGVLPFSKLESGFRAPVRLLSNTQQYTFSQNMTFNGSEGLRFTPVGQTTDITLESPWPHPSFQGRVLPVSRTVSENGFKAQWQIPSLARSYSNLGVLTQWPKSFNSFVVGVDLHETGMLYGLVQRSVKYGILFIGLTFVAFMIFEMALKARLHPAQYGLVGLSMVVFYLVLLSLSEHIPFVWAYASATSCTILMVSLYAGTAMGHPKYGWGIGAFCVGLYTLLYALLQMEDYALLMGTALVVIMLGALMYVSRNMGKTGHA